MKKGNDKETFKKRLLDILEKDRFSLITGIVYIFILGAVRSIMEGYVGDYKYYSIYLFTQHVLLSYPEILMAGLVVYAVLSVKIRKIWNVVLMGFFILLIPPIADYFIYGEFGLELGQQYDYLAPNEIIPTLTKIWNPNFLLNVASRGQGIMFLLLIWGTTIYVAMKTDLAKKFIEFIKGKTPRSLFPIAVAKTIFVYIATHLIIVFIGAFTLIINVGKEGVILFNTFTFPIYNKYYLFFSEYGYSSLQTPLAKTLASNQRHLLLCSYFIILTIVLVLVSMYLDYKKHLVAMLKHLRLHYSSAFILSAFLGVAYVHSLDPDFSKGLALDPFYILHMPYLFISFLTVFLLTQFTLFIDDISLFKHEDKGINALSNGEISRYHYIRIAIVYGLAAIYLSYVLGNITLVLSLIWITVTLVASYLRWYKSSIGFSKIGIYGVIAFFMGIYTPGVWISKAVQTENGEVVREVSAMILRRPDLGSISLLISIWLVVSLSVIFFILKFRVEQFEEEENISYADSFYIKLIIKAAIFGLMIFPLIIYNQLFHVVIFGSLAFAFTFWYHVLDKKKVILYGYMISVIFLSLFFIL